MGAFNQLLRLFWKNYVLRKRQPLDLLLELIWPILIFGIVAIIRSGIPPKLKSTCSYHERAMPSAGLIPFLQSSVCTLNNPCKTPEQLIQTQAAQQKLTSLLANLQPYLTKSETLDALEAFHTVEKVIDLLKNASENATELERFHVKLRLKNLFKDSNEIYSLLVNDFKVLSAQEARTLLDGTLNVFEILDLFGNENSDFENIVCNMTRLQIYIIFSNSANVSEVSRSLCAIDKNMISNITNTVLQQLSVANMISIAADFAAYTGRFEYSSAIGDFGKVVEYMLNSPSLMSVLPNLQYLSNIPALTSKLAAIIPKLQKIDFASINAVAEFIEPVINSTGSDYQVWKTITDLFAYMQNVTISLNAESFDWNKLFRMAMPIVKKLSEGNSIGSLDVLIGISTNSLFEEMYNVTTQLLNGSLLTDISTGSLNKTIDMMEAILRSAMSERDVNSLILTTDKMVQIMNEIISFYEAVEDTIETIMASGSAVANSLSKVFETGPNTTLAFIKVMADPGNILHLMKGDMDFKMICLNAVESLSMDEIIKNTLRTYACTADVASEIESLVSRMQFQDFNTKMERLIIEMAMIYIGITNPTSMSFMKDLYYNIQNVYSRITGVAANVTSKIKTSFTSFIERDGINWNGTDWEKILDQSSSMLTENMFAMIQSIGPYLENTTMWLSIGPYLRTIDIVVQHMNDQMVLVEEMSEFNSTMSRLISYTNFMPEFMESFLAVMDNQQMMMEILSAKNVTVLFCEKTIMQRMNLPASVPVNDIEKLICTTNWEEFGQQLASMFTMMPTISKIEQLFNESDGVGTSVSYNWTNIVKNAERISYMLQNSDKLMTQGPWYTVMQMNFTKMGESLQSSIVKMEKKITSGDLSDINAVAEFIEPVINSTGSDYQVWKTITDLFAYMQNVTISLNAESFDWNKLFRMAMPIVKKLSEGNSIGSLDVLIGISTNSLFEEMYNVTTQLLNGSLLTDISTGSLNKTIDMMEAILRSAMSERDVNSLILTTDKMVQIMNEIISFYEAVEDTIETIMASGSAVANSLSKVFETGPNTTLAFIKVMADPGNILHLMKGDMDFKMICLNAVESLSMDEIIKNTLRTYACTADVASEIESLVSRMQFQDFNTKMERLIIEMAMIYIGITNPTSMSFMKDLYYNIQNVYSRITGVAANVTSKIKTSFTSFIERDGINWNGTDWEKILDQSSSMLTENMFAMIQSIGPYLENTTMWLSIGPYLRTIDIVVQHMNDQMVLVEEMSEFNSTMSRLISYTNFMPEFMESFLAVMDNQQMMMEILSAKNVTVLFCEKTIMQRMNLPASVPVNDIEKLICTTNWEEFGQQLASMFTMMPTISKIEQLFNESDGVGTSVSYNWTNIVKNAERISYMLQNSDKLMTQGPWYTVMQMNFTKMGESLQSSIVKMEKKITSGDLSDINAVAEFIEPVINSTGSDYQVWKTITDLFAYMQNVTISLNAESFDWNKLFRMAMPIVKKLSEGNSIGSLDVLIGISTNSLFEEMYNVTTQLLNGSLLTDISTGSLNKTIDMMEAILRSAMSERDVNSLILTTDKMVQIMNEIISFYEAVEDTIETIMASGSAVANSLSKVFETGPNTTLAFIKVMADPGNILHLMKGDMDFKMICLNAVESLSMDEIIKNTLRTYACTADVASEIESLVSRMQFQDFNTKMERLIIEMAMIYIGITNPTSMSFMKDLYYNIQNVYSRITGVAANVTSKIKTSFTSFIERDGINWNGTDWEKILDQSSSMLTENMFAMIQSIGPYLENTTMWLSIGPYLRTIDIVVQHMNDQMVLVEEMSEFNSTMSRLISYTNFMPEFMESFLAVMDNQQMMMEILSAKNVTVLFCEKTIMQRMNLPASVPVNDIEKLICTTNWEEFGQQLASMFTMMPTISKIEQLFNESDGVGTSVSYNWTNIVKNAERISYMLQNSDKLMTQGPWYTVMQMNFTKMGESLQSSIVKMEKKITSGDLSDITKIGLSDISQLDLSLKNVSFWTYTKHYITAWTAYTKIFNSLAKKLRDNNFNLIDYITDLSPTLGKHLKEMVKKIPELIHAMDLAARKPEHLLRTIFTIDWSKICNGTFINEIFVSDPRMNLRDFEDGLCKLNWTQITHELLTNDLNLKQYSVQLTYMSMSIEEVPDITVNWTDLVETTTVYLNNMINLSVSSYWPTLEFPDLNIDNISMSWNEFVIFFNMSDQQYINRLTSITYEMMTLFDMLENSSSSLVAQYKEVVGIETYLLHHIMVFYIEQLKILNRSIDVNILQYLNSKELNKIIRAQENTAELNYIIAYNFLHMINNPQKIPTLLSTNVSAVCDNVTILGFLLSLPPNSMLDLSTLQSIVCGVNINYTALMDELSNNLQGFKEMVNAFSNVLGGKFDAKTMHINFTTIMEDYNLVTILWDDIRESPPNITPGWSESVFDRILLQQQWEEMIHKLIDSLSVNNLIKIIENSHDVLSTWDHISPEFSKELKQIEFMYRILGVVLDKFDQLKKDSYFNLEDFFKNSTEARHIMLLIQKDGVLETLLNSANSQKFGELIMNPNVTEVIVTLCTTDLRTYLSVPAHVMLNLTSLQLEFCAIDFTNLVTALVKEFKIVELMDALQSNISVDWKFVNSQYARITSRINRWLENPTTLSIPLRWQNESFWYQMLISYSESRMDPTSITKELASFLQLLEPLRREEPMRQFGLFLEAFLALVNRNRIVLQSTNLTLNTLATFIPALRDIFSSLELRPDVVYSILHAPIRDQKLLAELFTSLDIVSELCSNGLFWNSNIDISDLNTTEVQDGFCKLTNSSTIDKLLQGLNFTEYLQGMNDTSIVPDWKTIIAESLELSNIVSSLVNNSDIRFDFLQALSRLQCTYNTCNLLNLLSLYTAISNSTKRNDSNNIIGSGNWELFSGYVQGIETIVKVIDNMIRKMNPKEGGIQLALLFTNTSKVRSLLESLPNMDEDYITSLLTARIKPGMESKILALISNTTNMAERICNDRELHSSFDFLPTFNASMMVESLCKANESRIIEELLEMLDISKALQQFFGQWKSSEDFDIHNFVQLIQDLSETFLKVVNATDIDLGSFTAQLNLNVTKMENLFMAELDNLAMNYPNVSPQLLEPLFSSLLQTGTVPTDFVLIMQIIFTWTKEFQTRISELIQAPINISTLLQNTELSKVLRIVSTRPELIDDLFNVHIIQPDKLVDILSNFPDPKSVLCGGNITEILTAPANSSFWLLYEDLCAINDTLLFWESLTLFSLQYRQTQLLNLLEQNKNELRINVTGITQYSTQLVEMLMTLVSNGGQNNATMDPSNLFNISSWQTILESLGLSLSRQYGALIQKWIIENSHDVLSTLDHISPEFSKELKQIEFMYRILGVVLDKFDQLKKDSYFNLEDFFKNSTEATHIMLMIQKDGVLETLLNSANSQKFGELIMNPNVTEVIVTLCTTDLRTYLSVPAHVMLNLTSLQLEFCAIDFTNLVTALVKEFKIVELMDALQSNISVDWKFVNSQYARITSRINRWLENPTTLSIPLRWQNESFWYQMLISYSESRMDPTSITKELASFLQLLEPLRRDERMRQFGLFLETFLALVNRNRIVLQSTNLTLNTLATFIPALRDIFSSLELRPDVVHSILHAPIRDQKLLAELFTSLDIVSELCSNGLFWNSNIDISDLNTTEVQDGFCKLKNSSTIDKLLQGLNFTEFLQEMNETSIIPDWKTIIAESLELSNIVSSLVNNSDIRFDFLQALSRLQCTYNTCNLLNLLSLYTAISNSTKRNDSNNIIGSGNWELFSGYVQGIETIVKVIDNMIRKMNPKEGGIQLALLFTNTSKVRSLLESLPNMDEDYITSLLTARIKPGMESKILALISNTTNMAERICNDRELHSSFDFLPTFNASMMVESLCKANESRIIEELLEMLDISKALQQFFGQWKSSEDFYIHNFVQLIQDLSETFLKVVNATDIDLGSFTAQLNLNVTKMENLFMAELDNLAMNYPNVSSQLLEPLFSSLLQTGTVPTDFVLIMQIIFTWTKEFQTRISELIQAPINISTLLQNTELSKVLRIVSTRPELIDDLFNVHIIQPDKLVDILSNVPDPKSVLCGGNITEILTAPANSSFWLLYEDLCAINDTLLFWESLTLFSLQYRQTQLLNLLEQNKNELRINVTGITQYSTQLVEMLMTLVSNGGQNNATMDPSNLFNISSWQNILESLGLSLSRQYGALIQKWSSIALQFLGQVPSAEVSKSIMTFEVILGFMSRQLKDFKGNVTIDQLLRGDTDLKNMLYSVAKLNNIGAIELLMNRSINIDALLQIVNPDLFLGLCQNGTLAEFITKTGTNSSVADDLEKILCVYPESFWQALQNRTEAQILEQQLSRIWNSTYMGAPDWVSLSKNIETFSTLMSGLLSKPIYMDDKLINLLDFNMSLESAMLFFNNPARIFDALSQLGSVLNYTWLSPFITSFDTSVRVMMGFLTEFKASGKSLEQLLTDPNTLSKLMLTLTSVDDQLRIFAESYTKSVLTIAGGIDFYQRLVCNETMLEMLAEKISPLSMPMSVLSNALCQHNASNWYSNLLAAGFSQTDIMTFFMQLIESNPGIAAEKLMAPPSWTSFVNLVQKFTDTLSGSQFGSLSNVLHMDMTWLDYHQLNMVNNSPSSFFNILKLLDSGSMLDEHLILDELRGFFKMLGTFEQNLNKQLEKISEMGWNVPLSILLPNSTLVAQLLSDAIGTQSAASFLIATINPEKFVILALSNNWKNVVCNETEFSQAFMFPLGVNVSSLQKDLCVYTLSHESAVGEILQKVDMMQVLSELNNWMSMKSNVSSGNNTNDWDDIRRQTVILVDNIRLLLEKGSANFSKWLEPVLTVLDLLNSPSINSIGQVCDRTLHYIEGMDIYGFQVLPTIEAIYNALRAVQIQMSLLDVIGNVVCGDTSQNLTSVIQKLKANGVLNKIKELVDIYTGSMSGSNFTCTSMVQYSNEISTLFSKSLTKWMNHSEDLAQCVTITYMASGDFIQNIQRLFSTGGELLHILKDPEFVEIGKIIDGNDQLIEIMEYVIRAFLQQQKVTEEIRESIKKNITSIEVFFKQTLQLTTDALYSMMNATFGIDLKTLQENFTAEVISTVLCNPENLKKVVRLPEFINVSYSELSSQLCGQDINTTSQIAAKLAELAKLALQLQYMQSFESNWWYDVMNNFSSLIRDIQGLPDLVGLLNQIKSIDLNNIGNSRKLLSTIQRLLVDSGPDDLIDSFNALLQNFGQISPDNVTMGIFADVRMLTKGLLGLKTIRSLIISNIEIANVIKDQDEFKTFLMKDLGLSETVVDAVIKGVMSFEMLLHLSHTDVSKKVCNATELEKLISLNTSRVSVRTISEAFCSLDRETIVNLTEAIIVRLDIGDLIEEMITKGFTSFLTNAGVTPKESKHAVGKITAAQGDFKVMLSILDNQTYINEDFIATLAEAQTEEKALSVSSLLCGSKDSAADDSFNLNSAIQNDASTLDSHLEEMMNLPGEFCRDLYKDIMKKEGGPIIWGYLKPIMRGKILYTPDTPVTRKIVQKINDTFGMLESLYTTAKQWAAGSESLKNLYGSKEAQDQLQKLLTDRFIQSLMVKVAGVPAEELQNSLYAFNNTDPSIIKSLSNAARLIENYTSCLEMDRFIPVPSEDQLDNEGVKLSKRNGFLAGLVFINVEDISMGRRKRQLTTDIPKHMKYKLRMDIDNVQHTERLKEWFWRPIPEDNFEEELRYLHGFVQLQDMIERAIISLQIGQDITRPGLSLKQFPFPCHKQDDYISGMSAYLLPIVMTTAWIAGIAIAARNLVCDREDGQEETLQVMGMRSYLNWWAWFLSTMIMMAVVTLCIVIILKYGNIYRHTDFGILYLYILDFCFSTTMLCYLVSAFFTQTTMAMLTVLIVYLISYLPFVVLISIELEMKFWQKTLACLSSTSSFAFSGQYLARYEEQLIGIQWSNINSSPIHGDSTSFSWTCIMMVIDGAIYLVLGWYIRHVKPGKFGVSQPWYFPLSPSFWGCTCTSSADKYKSGNDQSGYLREQVDKSLREALSTRGLSKVYSKKQGAAVDDVNMSIYDGHVTVMLGHNGAAKTSLINMLIGILKPSRGEVLIYNRPQQKAKSSLGICPQHNSLFLYMTVIEHMEFYASIKSNRSGAAVKEEIKQLLCDVDLWYVRHTPVKHLSGGMKRRLCVVLAFVGESKIVVLDEPTSGIDPNGRRAIWNLIIGRKNGCAVLLSTHHLDEADVLGDRIILMHKGKILCSGSPLFLKQSVGSGYRLIVTKDLQNENHNVGSILALLQARVPNAKLAKVVNNEYTFFLPTQPQYDEFEHFFFDLETKKETLDISEYALTGPTLDEVFLKVSSAADMGQPLTPENISAATDESLKSVDLKGEMNEEQQKVTTVNVERRQRKPPKATGCALKSQQFRALISKRFHHYRRDWRMFISVLLLPIAMFAAALGFHTIRPDDSQARNLLLTPPMYGPHSYIFVNDPVQDPLTSRVMDTFIKNPGIGTTCMKNHESLGFPFECIQGDSAFTRSSYSDRPNATCRCDDFQYMCDEGAAGIPPLQRSTITTDILQNLTGYNIENYLLDSFHNFTENRYGGWSFETATDSLSTSNLTAKVWFNNKGHHALPAFVNALNNALLRVNVDLNVLGNPAEYGITAYNHPFTFNRQQLSRETILQNATDVGISLIIIFAFTFVPLGLILFVLSEDSNKERHLQYVGGVGMFMYWMTSLIWDLVMYCIPVALAFALLAIFRLNAFWARENAAAVIVLLLLYGWALLPMMYTASKLFKDVSSAYFTMICINLSIAIATLMSVFLLNFFQSSSAMKNAYRIVKYVFLIFPPYCLGEGLIRLTENQIQSEIFARFGTDSYKSPFNFDFIAWNLVAMAIEGFVFFIILFVSEARWELTRSVASLTSDERSKEDKDVRQERLRVQIGYSTGEVLILNDLSKVFKRGNSSFFAVDHISFGVPKGQCFGLLGFNGAGKTTTFRMLTGDIAPSGGVAQILSKKIRRWDSSIGVNIGYCPQVDALDRFLTVSELLYCHASLKGIPASHIKVAVEKVMSSLQLNLISNKVIKNCSGGMKRKISLAIALIGDPPLILLDEPTTGMDPASKRLAWNCLHAAMKNGQSIILTSHSMEECDILCGRLAIMVNGQLKCLGSPQQLKYKFGEGYTVTLYMSGLSTSQDRLHEFIHMHFPGAIKRSHHQNVVQLDIPSETTKISQIFRVLEREKHNYNIMYYTVSQATLETIFLNIARDQVDECFPIDVERSFQSELEFLY